MERQRWYTISQHFDINNAGKRLFFFILEFDQAISHRFPYRYARFMNEAILAIPPQSYSPFSFEQLKHFSKELSLSAKVTFVVRGGICNSVC